MHWSLPPQSNHTTVVRPSQSHHCCEAFLLYSAVFVGKQHPQKLNPTKICTDDEKLATIITMSYFSPTKIYSQENLTHENIVTTKISAFTVYRL